MYKFSDTINYSADNSLPAEAVSIDGVLLDETIEGYRTLYVAGRESLAAEFDVINTKDRSGDVIKAKRYPSRTLKVGFQIMANSAEEFRSAFNKLNGALNCLEVEIRFADEPDFYFVGSPFISGDIDPGMNSVVGEFEIFCADPFKYSSEHTVSASTLSDGTVEITVPYAGTVEGHPILEAQMYRSASDTRNGDNGYVAYINGNTGAVLQFGNVTETDTGSKVIFNKTFDTDDWTAATAVSGGHTIAGTAATKDLSGKCIYASAYGSGTGFHGPGKEKTFTAQGNFSLEWKQRFAIKNKATKQQGMCQVAIWAGSTLMAAVNIKKNTKGNNGTLEFIVGSQTVKTESIDLSYNNKYFGFAKAATKKKPAINPVLNCSIKKDSKGAFNFSIGGVTYSMTDTAQASTKATKVTIFFGQNGTAAAVANNAIYSCKLTQWDYNTKNTFGVNDLLIVDTRSADVRMTRYSDTLDNIGRSAPEYGALGNEWEEFTLSKGNNIIQCEYSSWVSSTYKPTFKCRWRDVYI